MNDLKFVILLLSFCCLFINCKLDGGSSSEEEMTLAKEICECVKPVLEINEKLKVLKGNTEMDVDQITDLVEMAGEREIRAFDCSRAKKKGEVNIDNLKKAIDKNCTLPEALRDKLVSSL